MKFLRTALIASVAILFSAFLSACGFTPMHAPNSFGNMGVDYNELSIVTVNNEKIDFLLKQALRDRVGEHTKTRYRLTVEPRLSQSGLGRGTDDVASRYDLTMTTKIELLDTQSGQTVYTDTVSTVTTYGAPLDPYGEIAAQSNATEQIAVEATDRILVRLARYKAVQK